MFAVLAFLAGSLMLASAMTPAFTDRLRLLSGAAPPLLIDLSHFAASVAGFLLLILSAGLWRRRRGAYWAALVVLLGGAVFSLLKGLDWEEAAALLAVALMLFPCREAFRRRSRLAEPLRPSWLMLVCVAVLAMLWLGLFAYRGVDLSTELWWTFLVDRQVSGFVRDGTALALLTLVAAALSLMAAPGASSHGPASALDLARARAALELADQSTPEAWLAMLGDKALLFSPSGRSFIAYRVRGRRWIAMGGPAGARSEARDLLWTFAELADSYGGSAVFYSIGESLLGDVATMGFAVRKVGETALVDAARFTTEGKGKQNLRTALNRAEREGASFEVLPPGSATPLAEELRQVSNAWLGLHQGEEKAFSLGRFDPDYLDLTPLAVVREEGRIVAFANILMGEGPAREAAIDLMRHSPDGPHGVMDYLFVRCIQWARAEGLAAMDLGMAPLAGLEDRRLAPVFARVGALVFEEGGALYGFQGLRSYKAKFFPDWKPRFIAAPISTPLPLALLDVALLSSGGWPGLLGLRRRI
ncbi:phosphatidylglycerol lysyltransferase domain-containing protein [Brevundimonas sp. PAMC22021]|uniref:phosphatidylglycerol lysyltransferase domain-containing protein n=1 Tax=Brevundimonas sp. PAMC22021 TaxID=2861285 RepID=UPI001C633B7A|nr:phosphatidylglycerol lysyltransferase domain-containing protein [Brevundimonas sp. PAMC22021]QYF86923.1 phosphatidylglycerol lysyltransferase domain-containing protein [Brevundimonas sp. PAMC22021]